MIDVTKEVIEFMANYLNGDPECVKAYKAGLSKMRESNKTVVHKNENCKCRKNETHTEKCNKPNVTQRLEAIETQVATLRKQLAEFMTKTAEFTKITTSNISTLTDKLNSTIECVNEIADDAYEDTEDEVENEEVSTSELEAFLHSIFGDDKKIVIYK